jgi:hypothetical protein
VAGEEDDGTDGADESGVSCEASLIIVDISTLFKKRIEHRLFEPNSRRALLSWGTTHGYTAAHHQPHSSNIGFAVGYPVV